ncbi:uncharacterized protein LOC107042261, partial [Diachasma alloeum]|uniref:uncharacterized protein LOC107042261 n=1 Tax=Diachasma alloeum TaxID=454923 RepID=UPI000738155C
MDDLPWVDVEVQPEEQIQQLLQRQQFLQKQLQQQQLQHQHQEVEGEHLKAALGRLPLRLTSDRGRQFESDLFNSLARVCGSDHLKTTAYNPEPNGLVERIHHQLKAAIMCHASAAWVDILPVILMEFPVAWKEDVGATPSELVF